MKRSTIIAGIVLFAALWLVVYHSRADLNPSDVFASDGAAYSAGARYLLEVGTYSIDGIHPFTEREPGYSVFLAALYALFGVENILALYVAQGMLIFVTSVIFARAFRDVAGERAAAISFFLMLASFSVLHVIFSSFREVFALATLLLAAAAFLSFQERQTSGMAVLFGMLLGSAMLTYYSLAFFPFFLAVLLWRLRVRLHHSVLMVGIPIVMLFAWNVRTVAYTGDFGVAKQRIATTWYVRGEQAQQLHGLEPLRCLWAEYVSRDWTGRSQACSFNGLKNTQWEEGMAPVGAADAIVREGKRKVLRHLPSYLWFSLFEILELHLPFVGGGWSFAMNFMVALTAALMYLGLPFAIPSVRERRLWFLLLLPIYNTISFSLTDATPRYLLPVLFCYAAFAGIGYNAALRHFLKD